MQWNENYIPRILLCLFPFFSKCTNFQAYIIIIFLTCVKVVFLATANVKNTIPAPLLDRMELIDLVLVIQQSVSHQNSPPQSICASSNGRKSAHIYNLRSPARYTGWLLSGRESKNRFGVRDRIFITFFAWCAVTNKQICT